MPTESQQYSAMDRRRFVQTAGGILIAVGSNACGGDETTEPTPTGTVRVLITGLDASATSGGSAVVTPIAGTPGSAITVSAPASGMGEEEVPVGTYRVDYTPPAGFALAAGVENPRDVTITEGQVTVVEYAVTRVSNGNGPNIYGHGFEDGTSGEFRTGNGLPFIDATEWELDTAGGARGSNSVRQTYLASAGNVGTAFFYTLASPTPTVYTRFAYRQSNPFNGGNADEAKINRGLGPGFAGQWGTLIVLPGGAWGWKLDSLDTTPFIGNLQANQNLPAPNANAMVGEWHWIEILRDISVTNALKFMIWIDDVLYFDYTIAKSNQGQTYGVIQFDGTVNSMAQQSTAWFDEIGMSTEKMGIPT